MGDLYRVGFKVWATAYVIANSQEEAEALAKTTEGSVLEVSPGIAGEVEVSGLRFDDPRLPSFSISPAMTLAEAGKAERV